MACTNSEQWDRAHKSVAKCIESNHINCNIPSSLYTDENPATTIKGTGFKNKSIALRSIELTSQPGVRYKQYWTIRALRERAVHHPHKTNGIRDAISVFDQWLDNHNEPRSDEEIKDQKEEWEQFKKLCHDSANIHSYGKNPTREELKRARDDLADGKSKLIELLSRRNWDDEERMSFFENFNFPITSFVSIFGGPGLHGYGKHEIIVDNEEMKTSRVEISGSEGLEELVGAAGVRRLGIINSDLINVLFDRQQGKARVEVRGGPRKTTPTLSMLWKKQTNEKGCAPIKKRKRTEGEANNKISQCDSKYTQSWTCSSCTFIHVGKLRQTYLACEVCRSERD